MTTPHSKVAQFEWDLLPHIVDRLSRDLPNALYIEFPRNPRSYEDGFRAVTYRDLATVVNELAWWIDTHLGRSQNSEVIAYIGPNDLRYIALILAAAKTGYTLFLTSPRNSLAAHGSLFDELGCRTLLTSSPVPALAQNVLDSRTMTHHAVPSVSELLEAKPSHYEFSKTYETNRSDPLFIVHTSGSTGIPKPLTWTHETSARTINALAQDPPIGESSMERLHQGKRCFNAFPPFHGACIVTHLLEAIPFGTVMIAPLPEIIPSAEGLVQALGITDANFAYLVPSLIAELCQSESALDTVASKLEMILYCGGDLPSGMGDKVATKLPIKCQFGASEIGLTSQLEPINRDPLDWRYVYFHPCLGIEFEEITQGVYELVVKRDSAREKTQGTFTIGPSLLKLEHEYRSRDLFSHHPTNPNLWAWRARADDIIVFLNGEKTNPVSMEQLVVARNHEVASALVVGAQRFQAALVLEPADKSHEWSTKDQAALIEKVWPSIQEANESAPAHARIEKSLVLITPVNKPMIRAGKGTIQRAATIAQYQEELDIIYRNADLDQEEDDDEAFDATAVSFDVNTIKLHLRVALSQMNIARIKDSEDFFHHGLDSLQALQLTRRMRRHLGGSSLSLSTVYNNSTVDQLAQAIVDQRKLSAGAAQHDRVALRKMLSEYQQRVRKISGKTQPSDTPNKFRVLLTGSTGTLGTHLLKILGSSAEVEQIYCLNRRENGAAIQDSKFASEGFKPVADCPIPITFLKGDLTHPQLGLDPATFETLRTEVNLVLHNAWLVNFNHPIEAFRSQLDGVIRLIELSSQSSRHVQLFYISSVSSVGALGGVPVPETTVDDLNAPVKNGYGMSKWLAEQLLAEASQHLGIPTSVARVGQIAGPRGKGVWNRAEWVPSMAISSMTIGAFPQSLGKAFDDIDWLPVEETAGVLTDLALDLNGWKLNDQGMPDIFHVANPSKSSWPNLLNNCTHAASSILGRTIDVVPAEKWIDMVESHAVGSLDSPESSPQQLTNLAELNPAARMIPFFRSIMLGDGMSLKLQTTRTETRCKRLQTAGPVVADDMTHWIRGWVEASPLVEEVARSS